ncbi:MAG: hypothetical protein P1U40_07895 [Coxiellaceae bacterium]|nr:hypothetical protein [Coxiellaceae bacterium]
MSRTERPLEDLLSDLQLIVSYSTSKYGKRGQCTGITHAAAELLTQPDIGLNLSYIDHSMERHPTIIDPPGTKFTLKDSDIALVDTGGGESSACKLTASGVEQLNGVTAYLTAQEPGTVLQCSTDDHSYLFYVHDTENVYLVDADQDILFNIIAEPDRWQKETETGGYFFDDEGNTLTVASKSRRLLLDKALINDTGPSPQDTFRERMTASVRDGKPLTPEDDTEPTPFDPSSK